MPDLFGEHNKRYGTPARRRAHQCRHLWSHRSYGSARGSEAPTCTAGSAQSSVFGFLTAYALLAVSLPFARKALGQHFPPDYSHQLVHSSW